MAPLTLPAPCSQEGMFHRAPVMTAGFSRSLDVKCLRAQMRPRRGWQCGKGADRQRSMTRRRLIASHGGDHGCYGRFVDSSRPLLRGCPRAQQANDMKRTEASATCHLPPASLLSARPPCSCGRQSRRKTEATLHSIRTMVPIADVCSGGPASSTDVR
jgi:hypothetical protein